MKQWTCLIAGAVAAITMAASAQGEVRVVGDVRGGVFASRNDNRNGTETDADDVRIRLRLSLEAKFYEQWQGTVRLAGHYSDEMDNHRFSFQPRNEARPFGNSTVDMFNIRYSPSDAASITVGRMQTKFELNGVAKKSLDRNDSPNVDIDYTDGVYATYKFESGWKAHLIEQYYPDLNKNQLGLAPNVVRGPLDFMDSGARVGTFFAFENNTKSGPFVQRVVDLSYLPDALLETGSTAGGRGDYIAVVGRTALAWPLGSGKQRFLLGLEAGYAPNTPLASAMKLPGSDNVNGYAWQTSFNFMEFAAGHSIGLVLGEAQAGWLISPDFRENERLIELRHQYVFSKKLSMESRVRQREELEKQTTAVRVRDDRDLYVRLTYKF